MATIEENKNVEEGLFDKFKKNKKNQSSKGKKVWYLVDGRNDRKVAGPYDSFDDANAVWSVEANMSRTNAIRLQPRPFYEDLEDLDENKSYKGLTKKVYEAKETHSQDYFKYKKLLQNCKTIDELRKVWNEFRKDYDSEMTPNEEEALSELYKDLKKELPNNKSAKVKTKGGDELEITLGDIEVKDLKEDKQTTYVWKKDGDDHILTEKGKDKALITLSRMNSGFPWTIYKGNKEITLDNDSDKLVDIKAYILKNIDKILGNKLKEGWVQFKFEDGSNPYVAKTKEEQDKMLKKYDDRLKQLSDTTYLVKKEKKLKESNDDDDLVIDPLDDYLSDLEKLFNDKQIVSYSKLIDYVERADIYDEDEIFLTTKEIDKTTELTIINMLKQYFSEKNIPIAISVENYNDGKRFIILVNANDYDKNFLKDFEYKGNWYNAKKINESKSKVEESLKESKEDKVVLILEDTLSKANAKTPQGRAYKWNGEEPLDDFIKRCYKGDWKDDELIRDFYKENHDDFTIDYKKGVMSLLDYDVDEEDDDRISHFFFDYCVDESDIERYYSEGLQESNNVDNLKNQINEIENQIQELIKKEKRISNDRSYDTMIDHRNGAPIGDERKNIDLVYNKNQIDALEIKKKDLEDELNVILDRIGKEQDKEAQLLKHRKQERDYKRSYSGLRNEDLKEDKDKYAIVTKNFNTGKVVDTKYCKNYDEVKKFYKSKEFNDWQKRQDEYIGDSEVIDVVELNEAKGKLDDALPELKDMINEHKNSIIEYGEALKQGNVKNPNYKDYTTRFVFDVYYFLKGRGFNIYKYIDENDLRDDYLKTLMKKALSECGIKTTLDENINEDKIPASVRKLIDIINGKGNEVELKGNKLIVQNRFSNAGKGTFDVTKEQVRKLKELGYLTEDLDTFDDKMDFLAKDEDEAIDGYKKVIKTIDNKNVKTQLGKIEKEEKAHKDYLEKVKKDKDVKYTEPLMDEE